MYTVHLASIPIPISSAHLVSLALDSPNHGAPAMASSNRVPMVDGRNGASGGAADRLTPMNCATAPGRHLHEHEGLQRTSPGPLVLAMFYIWFYYLLL